MAKGEPLWTVLIDLIKPCFNSTKSEIEAINNNTGHKKIIYWYTWLLRVLNIIIALSFAYKINIDNNLVGYILEEIVIGLMIFKIIPKSDFVGQVIIFFTMFVINLLFLPKINNDSSQLTSMPHRISN